MKWILTHIGLIFAFTSIVFARPTTRAGDDPILTPKFKDEVDALLRGLGIPGYTVAVVRPNSTIPVEYGAWGNRTEGGEAMTPDTLTSLASVSKAFTATAVGILIDDFAHGRNKTALPAGVDEFTWDTKLADLLPSEWGLDNTWASEKASIHDLLSHVTGLPNHEISYGGPNDTVEAITQRMRYLRTAFELREEWYYTNLPYMVMSRVVSRYSNTTFESFVEERIFTPLNMSSSTHIPSVAAKTGRFAQTWGYNGRRIPNWFTDTTAAVMAGPGGIISTSEDMARWVALLLNGGSDGPNGIPREVIEQTTRPRAVIPEDQDEYGLEHETYGMGWQQSNYRGHYVVFHDGGIPGISTLVTLFPNDGVGFVQLCNSDEFDASPSILVQLADAALGLKPATGSTESSLESSLRRRKREIPVATSEPTSSLSSALDSLTGVYTDRGFGTIELCSTKSNSAACKRTLSEIASVPDIAGNASSTLYAAWPRMWTSHLIFSRSEDDGASFDLALTRLFPDGYGNDTSPFAYSMGSGGATVEFEVEDGKVRGFGLFGTVLGYTTERQRRGKTVEERADQWFERV